jgi:phosphatidylserine/phosphatidylglycerophosphate/cardiolipin synthase-like enzyme
MMKNQKLVLVLVIVSFVFLGAWANSDELNTVRRFEFYLGDPVGQQLIDLFGEARQTIYVGMYYYMTPRAVAVKDVTDALIEVSERGVEVNVGLESRADVPGWSSQAFARLKEAEVNVRYYEDDTIQHLKAAVVDGRYVFVGSQNLSYSALVGQNWESGVIFASPVIAKKMEKYLKNQQ